MNEEKETLVLVSGGRSATIVVDMLEKEGYDVKVIDDQSHIEGLECEALIFDDDIGGPSKTQGQLCAEILKSSGETYMSPRRGYQRGKGKRKKKWESPYG